MKAWIGALPVHLSMLSLNYSAQYFYPRHSLLHTTIETTTGGERGINPGYTISGTFFLSHNNTGFQYNIAITNFLVLHMCEIRFHDVIDCAVILRKN